MAEAAKEDPAGLTPDERAYFTSRGEKAIPNSPAAEPPSQPPDATPDGGGEDNAGAPSSPPSPADPDKEPPIQDLKEGRRVPLGELQDERKKRMDAEERARQSELMAARMEERFKSYMDAQRPPPGPPREPPKASEDIFGAVDHLSKELDRRGKEIDTYKERLTAEEKQRQMDDWAKAHEAEFIKNTPDYMEALYYLRMGRSLELNAMGISGPAVGQQLIFEERQLMQRAANLKKTPPELAYEIAKARGYQKGALPGSKFANGGNGVPASDARRRLEAVEAGQRTAGSSMGAGGGPAGAPRDVTLKDLVSMSDLDFDEFRRTKPAQYRRLKGAEH